MAFTAVATVVASVTLNAAWGVVHDLGYLIAGLARHQDGRWRTYPCIMSANEPSSLNLPFTLRSA